MSATPPQDPFAVPTSPPPAPTPATAPAPTHVPWGQASAPPQPWPAPPEYAGWAPAPPVPPVKRRWGLPVYDRAQEYHRVLRDHRYRWWRPLVGLVVMSVTFLVISLVVTTAALLPAFISGAIDLTNAESDPAGALISDPLGLLGINLSLAALIPAAILGLLAGHQLRPGMLHSVVGRMRWKFLALCLLIEVGVTFVVLPLSGLVSGGAGVDAEAVDPLPLAEWLPFALVILLTTPLQAAGEEYGFRGYGMQALGAWVRNPWFAITVTSLLFAAGHGTQNPALFLNRFAFGMIAGYLTVRTGGLEAAIGIHVVNNVVALLLASAAGQLAPSLTPTEAPWTVAALDVAGMVLYAVLAIRLANRMRLDRLTSFGAPAPSG